VTTLKELEELQYNIEIDEETGEITAWKNQYLDDGYGFYFTAEVSITAKTLKDLEEGDYEIQIDGYTLTEVEEALDNAMGKCKLWTQKDKCYMDEFEDFEESDEELTEDCIQCKYLDMVRQSLQFYEDGFI